MINRRALIATGAAAVVGGGAWMLTRPQPGSTLIPGAAMAQESDAPVELVEIEDMVLGDPEAAVELIEYASFTCPHCANFHADQYPQLKADYIDTGRIRFVYREVYFDRPGLWASMVARCGGPERFFGITQMMYEKQREWATLQDANQMVEALMRIGRTAGVEQEALDACMQDAAMAQSLVTWYEDNRETHDINSTPSLVLDGTTYQNMPYGELAAMIDEKLAATEG